MKQKKARPSRHPLTPYLPLAAAAVVAGIVLISVTNHGTTRPTGGVNEGQASLRIQTPDGISLAADLTYPAGRAAVPTVILIHELSGDRHQWQPYISQFTGAGFAVLTYDMRGFGDSPLPRVDGDRNTYLQSLVRDVPAVLDYLRQQPRLSSEPMHLVGASLGANVAYVAAGSGLAITRTVLLSPSASAGVLDGSATEYFSPSGVLGVADQANNADLEALMDKVIEPKKIDLITGGGQGLELLSQPGVMSIILSWLKE